MGLLFRRRRPIARLAVVAVAAGRAPTSPVPEYVAPGPGPTGGEIDELGRLALMHDSGALSDDEFAAAKAQLLDT